MITETGIRRPDETFQLGQRVRYHHLACEMRLPATTLEKDMFGHKQRLHRREWIPTGERQGFELPHWNGPFPMDNEGHTPFRASGNKTVAVWPKEGEGFVVSLIRKGIGESVAGYESGYETPEWEPGYFAAKEWVWLYVIKATIVGMTFLLAPMGAVTAVPSPRVKELESALRWLGREDANGWVREKVRSVLPKGSR